MKSYLTYFTHIFLLALAYYIAGRISFLISYDNNIITVVIFAAEGIALASVLIYGIKILPGIFIGQLLLSLHSMPFTATLTIAMINTIEALIAVSLFNHFKFNRSIKEIRDVLGLVALVVFILQPFNAILSTLTLLSFSIIEWADYFKNLLSCWVGNTIGQLLFTPMILLSYANYKKKELIYYVYIALFFTLLNYIFQILFPIQNQLLLLAFTLPLTLYLAAGKHVRFGIFATVVTSVVSLYFTHHNIGVFVLATPLENIINLNLYFLFQILLVLVIGTLSREKRFRAKELEKKIKDEVEKNRQQQHYMSQQNRLAQMGEMLSMIAHQWRQPLNNLSLINQMLVMQYHNNLLDKDIIDRFEEDSSKQILGMSQTITDFSNFFKPEVGKRNFFLKQLINQSITFTLPSLKRANIKIAVQFKEDIEILGYPNELGQSMINIINNAKDILIERKIIPKEITITIEKDNENITMSIEDNAGGIDEKIINQIFDPYFSTKGKNGTGLGLYMTKIIIEEHMKGKITIENTLYGACFKITFPLLKT